MKADLATLNIHIDKQSKLAIYQQLAAQIRVLITSGQLSGDQQLPSSRTLCALLKVSRTSTLNAYNQLISEGLLVSKPAVGVFVNTFEVGCHKSKKANIKNNDSQSASAAQKPSFIGFDAGPDIELFPFNHWAKTLRSVWRKPDPSILRDYPLGGYQPLRETISGYLKSARNIDCQPEQVIITAGSRDAIALISKVCQISGKDVALEDPCYPVLRHGLAAQGATLNTSAVDSQGMQLTAATTALAWISAARQYPLGIEMSMERRLEWLNFAKQHQCWLVEDDYDCEFNYQKKPLATLFQLSNEHFAQRQQVIYVGSFSKLFFRTLRIGYLVVPENKIAHFIQAGQELGNLASVPLQPALAQFIGHRRFASQIRSMRRTYQQRRDFLHALMQQELAASFSTSLPSGGMHLVAKYKAGANLTADQQLVTQLASKGVSAISLSSHYHHASSIGQEQGLILGFSGINEAALTKATAALEQIIRRF